MEGQNRTLYPIKDAAGQLTGAWVDAEYNLYETSGDAVVKSLCKQEITGKTVQNNVFYSQSEWKIYPTFHIWLRTGTVYRNRHSVERAPDSERKAAGRRLCGRVPRPWPDRGAGRERN